MSFVDPRKPPLRFNMDYSKSVGHGPAYMPDLPTSEYLEGMSQSVEQTIVYPIGPIPIDPRPDLASAPEHPDRTDDPEFPYSKDGGITILGEMPNTFVVVESDPKSSTGIAPVPLKHSPVIPVAPRREKTLSDYYGVFGPPKRRS